MKMGKLIKYVTSFFAIMALFLGSAQIFGVAQAQERERLWDQIQSTGIIRVGVAESRPLTTRDPKTGEWSGFFMDVIRGYADAMGYKVEIHETTWGSLVAGLQAKRWDIAVAITETPERALAVNFSTTVRPYELGLLYDKNNPKITDAMKSIDDFDKPEITFVVMQGASGDLSLTPRIKNAKILRLEGSNDARMAIIAKRADIYVEDYDSLNGTAVQNPEWATTRLPEPPLVKVGNNFAVRKSVPLDELQSLNIYIENLKATGQIDKFYEKSLDALRVK